MVGLARDRLTWSLCGADARGVVAVVRPQRDKRELTERNQRMFAMRKAGLTFREIGATFNLTEVRAFMICKREEDRESQKYLAILID